MANIVEELMLLKQASQEQTAASQALLQEVAGKMADIDAKVKEATQAVPEAVSVQANVTFYVDINGSDETGSGTMSAPYRTVKHAILSTAFNAAVTILLMGSQDSLTPHVIDETIDIGMRKVTIQFNSNHLRLADSIYYVFVGKSGSFVHFSDYGGGTQYVHMSTDKVLLKALGPSLLHMGGYNPCQFQMSDAATLVFIETSYSIHPRGVSAVTCSRLSILNSEGSAPTTARVIAVGTDEAGSVLVNYWQSSLGSNYKDHSDSSRVANLVGSLNVVSM